MFSLFNKIQDESVEDQIKEAGNYPADFTKLILQGLDCDSLPNAQGELGRSYTNPIPTNGPLGEIKYLNRLRTDLGVGLIFHRIGSVEVDGIEGNVDIFETVSLDNEVWDVLYLHMYHPRRSTLLPRGYKFANFHKIFTKYPLVFGSNSKAKNFPYGISKLLRKKGSLGESLAKKLEEEFLEKVNYSRSEEQVVKVALTIKDMAYAEVSRGKYRGIEKLGKKILEASLNCGQEIKTDIDNKYGKGSKEAERCYIETLYEFIYFFCHSTMRLAYKILGHERRVELQSILYPTIMETITEGMFGHWPENLKAGLNKDFRNNINSAEIEYSKYNKLIPEKNGNPKGTLFWELTKNLIKIGGFEDDPKMITKCLDISFKEFIKMKLKELVTAAGKEI